MDDPKLQIVEKLKASSNILVTVSANPTADQLAACIATTLVLNKFKKNATAVFSGKVPPFLNFLQPAETIEKTTDSLRDFIISLDKSKADKLRYKVEDDVVKIFITPYRTSITQKDLQYSAGEFNVDVILALGVHHQQDLDKAITAHGRIFHDAVTMSINNTPEADFGIAKWEDLNASSLSELVSQLIDMLDPQLMDADIATALLTGIVAETSRFSNEKTHPSTMQVSSRLLEAGANQQLVNQQLADLIGTVVNLAAGTEIKPTADLSNEPLHHDDFSDELKLSEDGSLAGLGLQGVDGPAEEPAARPNPPHGGPQGQGGPRQNQGGNQNGPRPNQGQNPKKDKPFKLNRPPQPPEPVAPVEVVQPNTKQPVPPQDPVEPDLASVEELIGEPVEPTPSPMLEDRPTAPASGPAPGVPAQGGVSSEDDEEAARKAIEDALVTAPTSAPAVPDLDVADLAQAPGGLQYEMTPAPEPPKPTDAQQDAASPQPDVSAAGPMPSAPPVFENAPAQDAPQMSTPPTPPPFGQSLATPLNSEPAPLSMSPADQAFTMPVPPTSSMAPATPPPIPGQQPGQAQGSATPPPLPPPVPPSPNPNRF